MPLKRLLPIIALVTLALLSAFSVPTPARADSSDNRSIYWTRWDVAITNLDTTQNSFHVRETHQLQIDGGPFNGGDRHIPMGRLTDIRNIQVSDGSTRLRQVNASPNNCTSQTGYVCLSRSNGEEVLYYNFVQQAQSGDARTIVIDYDVYGALRSYAGGDQLYWTALADSRPARVAASTVTVQLPRGLSTQVIATYPATWTQSKDETSNTLSFSSPGDLGNSGNVEVRIQYAHNPAMAVPPWQAEFDRTIALQPIFGLIALIVSGLILIGGFVWLFLKYSSHKRGLPPIVVPEYLSEPPSDLPPAVAATLLDETVSTADVMATIFDLARRGLIVIEQSQHHSLLDHSSDFTFHRTDQSDGGLHPYEALILRDLFGGQPLRTLSSLRNTFYTTVAAVKSQLYAEVVSDGFFKQAPNTVQGGWIVGGILLVILAVGAGVVGINVKLPLGLSNFVLFPLGALALIGIAMTLVSGAMRSRTPSGEQEAAKWRAFRTYLKNIKKYTDLKQATDQFDRYIGYAIAFGIDKQWIGEFSRSLTAMPTWYYPTYMYGPWTGRYPGAYAQTGGANFGGRSNTEWAGNMSGGGGGLNAMSGNLTEGLTAMSGGLTTLLNSASSTLTSSPSSSGSGGFSGGGGGGGGSGGGSAGFH